MNTLQKYKNHDLFEVPEHYFEHFQQDVMQRVKHDKQQKLTTKKWISAVSVAASIAVIITLTFFIFDNRNVDEHFYVHEETTQPSILSLENNQLAEVKEQTFEIPDTPALQTNTSSSKSPEPTTETIVYRAVDYYLDDFTTDSFCEVMYDLECSYDY